MLLLFAVAALSSLRTSRAPVHERLALILFLFEICLVTPDTWSSRSADLRSFVEVYLMAVIVLLGRPCQRISRAGRLAAARSGSRPGAGARRHRQPTSALGLAGLGPGLSRSMLSWLGAFGVTVRRGMSFSRFLCQTKMVYGPM